MSNIVVRENVAWIYFAKCYPKNLIQFPLDLYLYIGQTLYPDNRPEQHMTEDKNNWKFVLLRSLTCTNDWVFLFIPIIREKNESFKNYMNRVGIIEKHIIRDFQTNYLKYGANSYGLNASDGGEHPANGGYRGSIPGETTGVKNIVYSATEKRYRYKKRNDIYSSKNLFLVYLYAKSIGEEDIIIDKNIFWNNVKNWWNNDIYNTQYFSDYLGIKNVSVKRNNQTVRGFETLSQQTKERKMIIKSRTLFSKFLQLYKDGVLDIDNIYCLDFFIWNAKLILEGKFDIKNSRPNVFYADFFEFRKIHHFTVDNLDAAIIFLKEIEVMTDISIPVGQQRLQCN